MKPCYGKCDRCVWMTNGGCSEWNGDGEGGGNRMKPFDAKGCSML